MSSINVDTIKSRLGGPPTLSKGVVVSAAATFSSDVSIAGTITYEDVTNVDVIGIITARSGIEIGAAGVGGTITAAGHAAFENGLNVSGIATASGLDAAISVWTLGASGTNHYTFTGPGVDGDSDPDLQLIRGQKYIFKNRSGGHPFRIQSTVNGSTGTAYNGGVTNNDAGNGTDLTFDVPYTAPSVLYYQCTAHANMGGVIYIGSSSGDDIKVGVGATIHASSGNAVFAGIVTATDLKVGTKSAATTGKAIAMAMVFGF